MAAPPYDVIDAAQRAELLGRSPYNVVEVDLPQNGGAIPTRHAAEVLSALERRGDRRPRRRARAVGARAGLHRPGRRSRAPATASSRACSVEDYGPGRIRPHERTHPGPKEDRLRLTRATRANLSPIFSLYDDPAQRGLGRALQPHLDGEPWGEVTDDEGTVHKLWRDRRRGRDRGLPGRAARHRAADRRRPPPLRDRARLPAGGAERRPRADVPGRAAGLRA